MKRLIQLYKNAFSGLSRSTWMLAVVMLINRAGTMVVPFLSVYLTGTLNFSVEKAGVILSAFGVGSMIGSYLGGWLTDKYGNFYVQVVALVGGGLLFFVLAGLTEYYQLIVGVLVLSTVAESLRPANSTSVASYSKPENVSRAFSLNRMAINLGFSVGPAIGGFLATISYTFLFIADGFTCITAGIFFFVFFFKKRKIESEEKKKQVQDEKARSPYQDLRFLSFTLFTAIFAIIFFQLFMILPIYYRDVYDLSEGKIGWLLALNGIVVFLIEMIFVYLFGKRLPLNYLISGGVLLTGFSFVILNLYHGEYILYISMFLLSLAEIMAMPFMATYTVDRSSHSTRGKYMGMYTLSYAVAFILSPYLGTRIIGEFNFETLWWTSGIASVFAAVGLFFATRKS